MTIDHPDGAALLEEARRTLLEALLPLMPADRRYDALMVANAMAIAARESVQARGTMQEMLAELGELSGAAIDLAGSETEWARQLTELEARLAREIREGRHDGAGPQRDAVRRYLRTAAVARLRISNPKSVAA